MGEGLTPPATLLEQFHQYFGIHLVSFDAGMVDFVCQQFFPWAFVFPCQFPNRVNVGEADVFFGCQLTDFFHTFRRGGLRCRVSEEEAVWQIAVRGQENDVGICLGLDSAYHFPQDFFVFSGGSHGSVPIQGTVDKHEVRLVANHVTVEPFGHLD